jgi:hypothetical protein
MFTLYPTIHPVSILFNVSLNHLIILFKQIEENGHLILSPISVTVDKLYYISIHYNLFLFVLKIWHANYISIKANHGRNDLRFAG